MRLEFISYNLIPSSTWAAVQCQISLPSCLHMFGRRSVQHIFIELHILHFCQKLCEHSNPHTAHRQILHSHQGNEISQHIDNFDLYIYECTMCLGCFGLIWPFLQYEQKGNLILYLCHAIWQHVHRPDKYHHLLCAGLRSIYLNKSKSLRLWCHLAAIGKGSCKRYRCFGSCHHNCNLFISNNCCYRDCRLWIDLIRVFYNIVYLLLSVDPLWG